MPAATKKKKPPRKRAGKSKTKKTGFFAILRRWTFPLLLLFLFAFSLAATFYIIFLHTPSRPLF